MFIFVTVLLDMLAIGMIIPVLPKLVVDFVGGDTKQAARIFGLFGTAWALMQFLFSPILGALSDGFGRRPVMLMSNFGVGLDYVLMALAPSLAWLFVGRVISGITSASISDRLRLCRRRDAAGAARGGFGLLGAAFGAGFIFGPALGGLAGSISPRLPFWVAAGLSFANACYGLLILPESLPRYRRTPFRWRRANPLGALVSVALTRRVVRARLINFLSNLAHAVLPSIGVLYMLYRYSWDERTVGLTLAGVGVASIIVQAGVVGPVTKRIGERAALLLGLAFGVVGFLIFAFARTGIEFWLGIPLLALWGLEEPGLSGFDEPQSERLGTGPAAGRQCEHHGRGQSVRAGLVHPDFRVCHFRRRGGMPGAPFLTGRRCLLFAAGLLAWHTTRSIAGGTARPAA